MKTTNPVIPCYKLLLFVYFYCEIPYSAFNSLEKRYANICEYPLERKTKNMSHLLHTLLHDSFPSFICFDADGTYRENSLGPGEQEQVGHVFVLGAYL